MANKPEANETFAQKLIRLWPVYLMQGVVWFIIIAIVYLLFFV
jgi:hypothetical protein